MDDFMQGMIMRTTRRSMITYRVEIEYEFGKFSGCTTSFMQETTKMG